MRISQMNEDLEFENSVVLALVQAFIGAIAPEVRAISITVDRVKRSTDIYVALSNAFQDMDDLFKPEEKKRGVNKVYWETNNGFCGPESRDTIVIVYDLFPTAVPDTIEVPFGETINFNVLQNDITPQQIDVTVDDEPDHGNFDEISEGLFRYQPDVTFSGEDVMIYKICNLICPMPACSTAVVTFIVGKAGDCEIYNLITPNGDDVNDEIFVPCLDGDGAIDNEVTIFNQYGDVVFHAQPYENDWKGTYNGQELPAGTYFYVVKFNGDTKPVSGFLQIQR